MPDSPPTANAANNKGFLLRAQLVFVVLGALYVVLIGLLTIPFVQTHLIYLHAVNIPWSAQFDAPEHHGLAPGQTLNLKLNTSDNVTLGAWLVLASPFHHSHAIHPSTSDSPPSAPPPPPPPTAHLPAALAAHPTVLFLHGNAANRAFPLRVHLYTAYARLGLNVLAPDYRGFGDSAGRPSERGLLLDARAAWDWLRAAGAPPEDVLLVGHSLGTAVAAGLAAELAGEGVRVRGVVLMAPFTSLRRLLDTYCLFGVLPFMRPLAMIPGAPDLFARALVHKFDTLSIISAINASVLFVHAEDDWEIPHTHTDALFDALLEPSLPPLPLPAANPASWAKDDWAAFSARLAARGDVRAQVVESREVGGWGTLREFARGEAGARVWVLKTRRGGHDGVLSLEGVQAVVRDTFGL